MSTYKTLQYLLENRGEYIVRTMGDKLQAAVRKDPHAPKKLITSQLVGRLAMMDPTPSHMYLQWLANHYATGDFYLEDAPRVRRVLTTFQQVKAQLPVKDINKYKWLSDLEAVLDEIAPAPSKKETARAVKAGGSKLIMKTDQFTVVQLLTQEAASYYGKGTKWCTSTVENDEHLDLDDECVTKCHNDAIGQGWEVDTDEYDDYFHECAGNCPRVTAFMRYIKDGPIYVILQNDGKRKWQLHPTSGQFMDEQDDAVDMDDLNLFQADAQLVPFLDEKIFNKWDAENGE